MNSCRFRIACGEKLSSLSNGTVMRSSRVSRMASVTLNESVPKGSHSKLNPRVCLPVSRLPPCQISVTCLRRGKSTAAVRET